MAAQPPPPRREAPPSTTGDPFKDQWDQLRPQLRSWWDRLTEADLMAIDGQKDRLISIVQQRYGDPHERAQQEVERRLREFGGRTAGVAATVTSAAQGVASSVAETARDGGHESPGDGWLGGHRGHRHGGRGRDLRTGEGPARALGRPYSTHPPLSCPGAARRTGDRLCPCTYYRDKANGSGLVRQR